MTTAPRRKLGELLLAAGVVDETRLKAALAEQKRWGGKLGRTLIDLGYVREDIMVKALSHQLKLPSINLNRFTPSKEAISLVPVQLCERYGVFPISFDATKKLLTLASSDPANENALREMRLELNLRDVAPMVAGVVDIDRAIRRHYWGEAADSSPTATMHELGLSERMIDLPTEDHAPAPAPTAARPRTGLPPPPPSESGEGARPPQRVLTVPEGTPRLNRGPPGSVYTAAAMVAAPRGVPVGNDVNEQMISTLQRQEKLLTAEIRSLRALVELLVEKGVVDREEYLKRVKGK
jgi:type IV pilus assembly protein PilB